jgi:hypothetical protein
MDREQLLSVAKEAFTHVGHGFDFEIIEAGVRQDGNWWYVPVIARGTRGTEPPFEGLVNIYANLEEKLQETGVNVMFVPAAA